MENTQNETAEICKEIRRKLKITQKELGETVGVSRRTIGAWERKEWEPVAPTLKLLIRIAGEKNAE